MTSDLRCQDDWTEMRITQTESELSSQKVMRKNSYEISQRGTESKYNNYFDEYLHKWRRSTRFKAMNRNERARQAMRRMLRKNKTKREMKIGKKHTRKLHATSWRALSFRLWFSRNVRPAVSFSCSRSSRMCEWARVWMCLSMHWLFYFAASATSHFMLSEITFAFVLSDESICNVLPSQ